MTDLQIAIEQLPRFVRDNVEYVALADVRAFGVAIQAIVQQWREEAEHHYATAQDAEDHKHEETMYVYRGIARGVEGCADELALTLGGLAGGGNEREE